MQTKTICKLLDLAAMHRRKAYAELDQGPPHHYRGNYWPPAARLDKAQEYERRAAFLLLDGAARWATRHPRSHYGLKSYHKLHATGTGSGNYARRRKAQT